MALDGVPVILSEYLTESEERTVLRGHLERWLSWPWRPWQKTKVVCVQVPSRQVLRFDGKLLMHPATWRSLAQAVEAQGGGR